MTPLVSIVVPTKDRPELLRRCLGAVLDQECDAPFEVVVVNDGGCPVNTAINGDDRVVLIDGPGRGPAGARNAGIAQASGDVVLFTDDDAIPQPGWVQAGLAALARTPDAVGVVGRVESPPFDPLYEHSVQNDDGVGNFLTCNAAYRRWALDQLDGFDEQFPYPAAEDRDLGYRMEYLGPVLFEPTMVVVHPPRPTRVKNEIRRARFVESEWRLHAKHPQTRPPRWSTRWGPVIRVARRWQRLLTEAQVVGNSPRRAGRFAVTAFGQVVLALWLTLRGPRQPGQRQSGSLGPEFGSALRIAWIGPTPQPGGGVAGCAWLIVEGLARKGCEVDCFLVGDHDGLPEQLSSMHGVRVVNLDTGWRYDRWYSNRVITKVLTGLGAGAWGRRRLASLVLEQHRLRPYDVLYQFSTIELFGLRRHLSHLPPLVVHPETHAAGELRAVRSERHLSARCEPWWRRITIEALLATRARRQGRDIRLADRVIAISRRFGEHLIADYGVDPSRMTVVPNPIDLDEMKPADRPAHEARHVAFVSRMSARKGVDVVVELSHRLADLEGRVVLDLVGAETLWSDYRPLLDDLHRGVARYHGPLHRPELVRFLASTDLLIQPATFEPFGLTVGEALACGLPIVVTDEVGAAEGVSPDCCIVVPAGDVDALESGIREMLQRLAATEGAVVRSTARNEATQRFAPEQVTGQLLDVLRGVAGGPLLLRSAQ